MYAVSVTAAHSDLRKVLRTAREARWRHRHIVQAYPCVPESRKRVGRPDAFHVNPAVIALQAAVLWPFTAKPTKPQQRPMLAKRPAKHYDGRVDIRCFNHAKRIGRGAVTMPNPVVHFEIQSTAPE